MGGGGGGERSCECALPRVRERALCMCDLRVVACCPFLFLPPCPPRFHTSPPTPQAYLHERHGLDRSLADLESCTVQGVAVSLLDAEPDLTALPGLVASHVAPYCRRHGKSVDDLLFSHVCELCDALGSMPLEAGPGDEDLDGQGGFGACLGEEEWGGRCVSWTGALEGGVCGMEVDGCV